jgi:hypothetical protein
VCSEYSPSPADQLSDDREIIGLPLEVVAEGPNSNGLLPIPADRVRSEGLPRDTLLAEALVASADGRIDVAALRRRRSSARNPARRRSYS